MKRGILPDAWYYALSTVITLVTLWIGAQLFGLPQELLAHDRAQIPASRAADQIHAITKRALANPDYGPNEYTKDSVAIARITAKTQSGGASDLGNASQRTLRRHLERIAAKDFQKQLRDVPAGLYQPTLGHLLAPQLTQARQRYVQPINRRAIGSTLLKSCLFGIFFSFGALGVLLLRVLRHSPRWDVALAIYRHTWSEILISSLFWMIGLSDQGYNPSESWTLRLRHKVSNDELARYETWLEGVTTAHMRVLPKHEAIALLWSKIWTSVQWQAITQTPWRLQTWRTFNRQFRNAVYLTIISGVQIGAGYRVAHAADTATAPQHPLTGVNYVSTFDPKGEAQPAEHLFFFGRDGTTLIFLGFTSPNPKFELSHTTSKATWDGGFAIAGPFVNFNEQADITAVGITGFWSHTSGRARANGPVYLVREPQKGLGTWQPGTALLYQVTRKLALGLGYSLFTNSSDEPSFTAGPLAEFQLSPGTSLRARYTKGGTGFFRDSEPRVRLDLMHRFK